METESKALHHQLQILRKTTNFIHFKDFWNTYSNPFENPLYEAAEIIKLKGFMKL